MLELTACVTRPSFPPLFLRRLCLPEPRAHCPARLARRPAMQLPLSWHPLHNTPQGLTLARQALYWLGCFPCQHSAFLKFFLVYKTEQKLGNPILLPHCKTTSLSGLAMRGCIITISQSLSPKFTVYIRTHIWWHPWALRNV